MSTISSINFTSPQPPAAAPEAPKADSPAPAQDQVSLSEAARKHLAAANGNLNELSPQEQRQLLMQMKAQNGHLHNANDQGQINADKGDREKTLRDLDGKVGGVRKGASAVTFGGSEEAIASRQDAANGNIAGATGHALAAGLRVVAAAGTIYTGSRMISPVAPAAGVGAVAPAAGVASAAPAVGAGEVAAAETAGGTVAAGNTNWVVPVIVGGGVGIVAWGKAREHRP